MLVKLNKIKFTVLHDMIHDHNYYLLLILSIMFSGFYLNPEHTRVGCLV